MTIYFILGDGDTGYDNLDTTDDRPKGDNIDSILGVHVMPTTFTVTQVQTVYATIPPSVITAPPDGIYETAIHVLPDNRYLERASSTLFKLTDNYVIIFWHVCGYIIK